MASSWGAVLRALASITAGGAGGAAQGLGAIDTRRQKNRALDLDASQLAEVVANNRAQQALSMEQAAASQTHQTSMLEENRRQTALQEKQMAAQAAAADAARQREEMQNTRLALKDYSETWEGGGVTLLNPKLAMERLQGAPASQVLDLMNRINQTQVGNRPAVAVAGTEEYGGMMYKGHPFNPYSGASSAGALSLRADQDFTRNLRDARNQIMMAYKNAYDSYRNNPATAELFKSTNIQIAEEARKQAQTYATQFAQMAGQGALNMLNVSFPDRMTGVTVQQLIGTLPLDPDAPAGGAPGAGGTPQDPFGTGFSLDVRTSARGGGATPPGAPTAPVTAPGPRAPQGNPADPFNTGKPMTSPSGVTPPAAGATPPINQFFNPLNFPRPKRP